MSYFGIGIYQPKHKENVGTLWRAAYLFKASFIFVIGGNVTKQASDTQKTYKQIPLFQFNSIKEFRPYDCELICVEQNGKPLETYKHITNRPCAYLLGSEANGIPKDILSSHEVISIETKRPQSMNVAMAGSIVMYDRNMKSL